MPKYLEFPCLTFEQNDNILVFFKVKAKELLTFASVARRTEETPDGYQRMFSEGRRRAIAKFIDTGNILPSSVLISIDNAEINKDKNIIKILNVSNNAWIIDGQHRILGAEIAKNEIEIPVVALINADQKDQILQFITINREAKGVPSSLYLDLLNKLPRELSTKEITQARASDIANMLNENENSPFYNRIAIIRSPKAGQISKANFVKKVEPYIAVEKGRLCDYDLVQQAKIVENYFNAIEKVFDYEVKKDKPIFYQTIGFGAFMKSFELIFNTILNRSKGGFEIQEIIKLLKEIFEDLKPHIENWHQYGTGEKAENAAAGDLKSLIQQINTASELKSSIRL